ncbi:hypothetical protein EOPP23_02325 [Endozoicomonas sp. OPT23]|uniref:energy transducer TonB n=1 Tax=Endozoicomonas sp. OPT23 TaxID=2072845 RepID=UPI00129B7A09|nr:TonB family protein [Endozoicomonas sp. OPT23]MRI31831.1 hypothetical protein [Endozoicomonas sp. OPT23]
MNISTACGISLLLHLAVLLALNTAPSRSASAPSPATHSVQISIRQAESIKSAEKIPVLPEPEEQKTPLAQKTEEPVKLQKPNESNSESKPVIRQMAKVQPAKSATSKPSPKSKKQFQEKPEEKSTKPIEQVAEASEHKSDEDRQKSIQENPIQQQQLVYAATVDSLSQKDSAMEEWKSKLYSLINQYKRYPYQAKRRKQEGDVQLKAVIGSDGSLIKAEVLSGNRLFHKSSLQALKQSMPLTPPGNSNISIQLNIRYRLL